MQVRQGGGTLMTRLLVITNRNIQAKINVHWIRSRIRFLHCYIVAFADTFCLQEYTNAHISLSFTLELEAPEYLQSPKVSSSALEYFGTQNSFRRHPHTAAMQLGVLAGMQAPPEASDCLLGGGIQPPREQFSP